MGNTRWFARCAWGVLSYNLLVVLWGAYVRATGSGAGCGNHWPLCNGEVMPRAPRLETIIEFTHRLTSGAAGLLVLALAIWALRLFPRGHGARRAAWLSFLLVMVEGALGAGLVLFQFVGQNASLARAVYLAAHLANTQLLLAALAVTAWLAGRKRGSRGVPWVIAAALPIALVVSISGAVAALGDTLFPATSLAAGIRQELSATAHVLLKLRLLHPVLAVAGGMYMIWAAVSAIRTAPPARAAGWSIAALALLQLVAGAVNVALLAPVWMQLVHLLLADLLWVALVVACLETTRG